jgi:hypothetical protein
MVRPHPSISFDDLLKFLKEISSAIEGLRAALEANDMDRLPESLDSTNQALDAIQSYPGGADKLKREQKIILSIKLRLACISIWRLF